MVSKGKVVVKLYESLCILRIKFGFLTVSSDKLSIFVWDAF